MTQAVSNFYLFINRRYGNNYGQLKRDMDTNRNDVIQFNELESFINANKSEMHLDNVTRNDAYSIWGELDLSIKGYNRSATEEVSENGSLNASEEKNLTDKIELYAVIDRVLRGILDNSSLVSALNWSNPPYTYNVDIDTLYYKAADILVSSGNINQLVDNGGTALQSAAEKAVKDAAAELIKEQIVNNQDFKNKLIDVGLGDYNLLNDANNGSLKTLIDSELNTIFNSDWPIDQQISEIGWRIAAVVQKYLITAQVGNYNQSANVATWGDSQPLNDLQMARLRHEYSTQLTPDTVDTNNELTAFRSELQSAIDKFISGKISELSNNKHSIDFTDLFSSIRSDVIDDFKNDDSYKLLKNIALLSNLNVNEDKFLEDGGYDYNNDDTDPNRIISIMFWLLGCEKGTVASASNKAIIQQVLSSRTYLEFLRKAYAEVLNDPSAYGVTDPNSQQQVQNAVMIYIKNHLAELLKGCGFNDLDTARILCNSAMGTNDYVTDPTKNNRYGNNMYAYEDVLEQVRQFAIFVLSTYSRNEYVMDAMEENDLLDINNINGSFTGNGYNLQQAMWNVISVIKEHPDLSANKPTPTDDNDGDITANIDKMSNPIGPGRVRCRDSNGNDQWHGYISGNQSHLNALRDDGIKLVGVLTTKLKGNLVGSGLDQKKVNIAIENTRRYFTALIGVIKDKSKGGTGDEGDEKFTGTYSTDTFYWDYLNEDETVTRMSNTANYTHTADYDKDWMWINAKESDSGVYMFEWDTMFNNQYLIEIEKDKIWEKFKEFYKMLG